MSADLEYIKQYNKILGKNTIVIGTATSSALSLPIGKNRVLVSDSALLRAASNLMTKLRHREKKQPGEAADRAARFFAMLDAFQLLAQKGVPVYFYNRIGKEKSGYQYTAKEQARMKAKLSFPKMYENIPKYRNELEDVFGELYSEEYVREIGLIPQVVRVGDIYQHENYKSRFVNVEGGKRITCGQPEKYNRTIHVYGRCGVFGYAVEDKDTLPSQIQRELTADGITNVRIVNHGLWGGTDDCIEHNFLHEVMGIKQGDIVLFYQKHLNGKLMAEFERNGVRYNDITHAWHERRNDRVTFFDRPGHMNADGYELTAKIICEDLIAAIPSNNETTSDGKTCSIGNLKYYLKTRTNSAFEKEMGDYIASILKEFPLHDEQRNNGAIVMNCNPFTYGHRFLIETAAKKVDRLYIFVVEEDKSFFRFEDRFEMVKRGTADIENVVVVPSGKFIISAYTFPEYFLKDYVKNKNFDVSADVETFCRYIAPPLHITTRFAGEEPFDPVTKNYNEFMARILPEHGLSFVEIPRCSTEDGQVINATKVRQLLNAKDYNTLKAYVPESTMDILKEKYC